MIEMLSKTTRFLRTIITNKALTATSRSTANTNIKKYLRIRHR